MILILAGVVAAVGLGFGIVLAPRIGRLADRATDDEEEDAGDRAE